MCGPVRCECSADPMMQANCYCRDCQRSSGGAMASVLLFPKAAVKLTKGQLKHYEVTGDSRGKVSRAFCPNCGSPIRSELPGMSMVAIKAGSLDDPTRFQPTANVYMCSAPPWAPVREDIPKFDEMPR